MNSSNRTLSFAISYGLVCGPLHGKRLTRLLINSGYIVSPDINKADIIITHSAGCWLIPKSARPKIVIYIGAVLNTPNATIFARSNIGNMKDFIKPQNVYEGAKFYLTTLYYALTQPRRNYKVLRMAQYAHLTPDTASQFVFVANRTDPWPAPPELQTLMTQKPWAFIALSGSHDNVWVQPENYTAIINHYAERLLA